MRRLIIVLCCFSLLKAYGEDFTGEDKKEESPSLYERFEKFRKEKSMDSVYYYREKLLNSLTKQMADLERAVMDSGEPSGPLEVSPEALKKEQLKGQFESVCQSWRGKGLDSCLFRILNDYPQAPILLKSLGDFYYKKGNWTEAEKYYMYFLIHQPKNNKVLLNLALVKEKKGERKKALRIVRALTEASPREAYFYQVCSRLAGEDLPRVAERWERLLKVDPGNLVLRKYLIKAWTRLGRNDKVKEQVDWEGEKNEQ